MAEPKYRTIKIPKPRSRGFRGRAALQQWQRSGGRQKQILNPETGKYEKALFGEAGQRQVQKLYPTKERGESIKKVEKAKVAQAKRQKAGAAEAKKKAAELAAKPKPKFKRDSRILDSFNATPLAKAGDGKVTFDDQTGKYVLDAFGAKKSYSADELKKEIAKSKEPKFKEDSKLVDAFNKTPLGKSGDGKVTFDPNTGKYVLDAFGAKKSYTADELNKEIKGAKPPKADPKPQLPPQPTPPAPAPAPVAKAEPAPPPPTTGRLTRGPGPEAPPPPPRVRITEEAPKPPAPKADLSALSGRDQAELNTVLKDLKNKVISPDFKTPTQAEIAEAVTKATGGRYTPPTPKVAEPPPPQAEPVVPESSRTSEPASKSMDEEFLKRYENKYTPTSGGPTIFENPSPIIDVTQPTVIDIPGGGQIKVPSIPAPPAAPAEPPMQVRTADFQDANNNGIDDRDEPDSGGILMPMPGQQPPRDAPPREAPPAAPPPPTFVNMDPLQGVRETYVPTNILGPSYDPNVREDYIQKMMQAGANIQQGGYPGFQMPTSAVPQVQFGGYGAPAPMAPLAPYAGLAAPPQPYSGAIVNPGTGEPEPVGMAPDPRLVNRPPGTGPIM